MSQEKYIYWRKDMKPHSPGRMFANIHLLEGYNLGTLADFRRMAIELRKTFPQATNGQIRGGRIIKSGSVKGFTIIAWDAEIPTGKYPGWIQVHDNQPEYSW